MKLMLKSSLRETNARFRKRFAYIERSARELGKTVNDLSLDEMEQYWQKAKKL